MEGKVRSRTGNVLDQSKMTGILEMTGMTGKKTNKLGPLIYPFNPLTPMIKYLLFIFEEQQFYVFDYELQCINFTKYSTYIISLFLDVNYQH